MTNCINCGKKLPERKVKKVIGLTCNQNCEDELRQKIQDKINTKEVKK